MSASTETVVMKFGGSSVADPDKIRLVAQRLVEARAQGVRVVATVSAMGDTTDGLLELAEQVSPQPHPRELDMLLSTGERIACALVAMAVHDLGQEAVSLTGSQAGIITDAACRQEEVRGPGVVGEQPVLAPGESFQYTSGCPLGTSAGVMRGTYQMVTADGMHFDVEIAPFALTEPYTIH